MIDGWYITIHWWMYRDVHVYPDVNGYTLTWYEYMEYRIWYLYAFIWCLTHWYIDIPPSHLKHPEKWGFWINATSLLQSIMTCTFHIYPLSSRCYQSCPRHVTWDFCSPRAVELCKWNLDLEVPSCQFHQKRRPAGPKKRHPVGW